MNYSLDAGPLTAYLNDETGAEQTKDVLTEPGSPCYMHFMNLCEIYYLYYRRGGARIADAIIQDLLDMGIILRDDHDEAFWKAAASIKGRHALSSVIFTYLVGANPMLKQLQEHLKNVFRCPKMRVC